MKNREQRYLELALEYRDEYNKVKWWKFKERRHWKKRWDHAVDCMIRFSGLDNNEIAV